MLPASENEWLWLAGGVLLVFVVMLCMRFNRRKIEATAERLDRAPSYANALMMGAFFGLVALVSYGTVGAWQFWAWIFLATVHLVQAVYFFLKRNEVIDRSPPAEKRRATFGGAMAALLLLPLAWVIAQSASGVELDRAAWPLSLGLAGAAAIGFFQSARQWLAANVAEKAAQET